MQFHISQCQVLILVILFSAGVQTSRVIRAAPGIETTGQYLVVLTPDTSHERFEEVAEKVQTQSLSSQIHKIEGPFGKLFVTTLTVEEAYKVSFKRSIYYIYINCERDYFILWYKLYLLS